MITRRTVLGSLTAATLASPAMARPDRVFTKQGYAVCGYDPVAYFDQSAAVEGQQAYLLRWHHAVWRFASASNLAAFERDPYAYAPQYGGYCAMSLAIGQLKQSNPEAWVIHDGKLYLTHSLAARDQWLQDPEDRITQAALHWRAFF